MKHSVFYRGNHAHKVTPCVGVWIETYSIPVLMINIIRVTPCVGVWIETLILITLDQPPI